MRIDILTLFPEMFSYVINESILKRAQEKGIIEINLINIRDYSTNKHKKVDDYPYGGGTGMVMSASPIYEAFKSITDTLTTKPTVIYLTPQGKVFNQQVANDLIKSNTHYILLCGHYEGIDERVLEEIVDEEISIGDFVLTGGEIPAMVLIDSLSRLVPGVLGGEDAFKDESHYNGLLEYPQYTRPAEFLGKKVPDVLLSGHHENINKWRHEQSLKRTKSKRPDMYDKFKMINKNS
jgi:tRNA (guanine37-N1)-methyltransferase